MFGADCDPIARQTVGTWYGHRFHVRGSGLMLNAMGAWSNRRDVQILSSAQNLSGRLSRPRCAKNAPRARFLLRSAPRRVRIPPPPPYLLVRIQKKKAPILRNFLNLNGGGGGFEPLVTYTGQTVFETAAFNHSATPPRGVKTKQARRPALELTGGESGI